MCSLKDDRDINRELNQFIRFAILVSTAIAAGCVIFRKYIILILFSGQFMRAYDLLAIQAIGDIFFVLFYIFTSSLAARRRFRDVVVLSVLAYNGLLLSAYYILTHYVSFGITGLNIAIACANIMLAAIALIYWRFDTGFKLLPDNVSLIVKSSGLIILIMLIPDSDIFMTIAKTAVSVLWFFVAITRDEMNSFAGLVVSKFKRNADR
jgi:O-antigen/teichoic acid export membrane protein